MSEEILRELNDTEVFQIRNSPSIVIRNDNGDIKFSYFYRVMGNWILTNPFFSEKCNFEELKILAKKVFIRWRPVFSKHYLFIKESFIITNLEDVMMRAVLFCALGDGVDKVNGMSMVQATAWSEIFLTSDREYYERARRAFRALFSDVD